VSRRSSLPIVAVLIVSLFCSGMTRWVTLDQRRKLEAANGRTRTASSNLSQLSSFTLGLVLGGLRGPLVMALWTSSESQKADRNLDDIDTKIELIRQLQPEFATVHLFQMWNKAYNISVQMASVPNKYVTILDALDYGRKVDAEMPDDINIIAEIGRLYFSKFAGAAEKGYFSPRLQEETLPDVDHVRVIFPAEQRAQVVREARLADTPTVDLTTHRLANDDRLFISLRKPNADAMQARFKDSQATFAPAPSRRAARQEATGRPLAHETLLDAQFNLLPAYANPRGNNQASNDAASGAELPYLKPFQPYPYGVSPYALAYNYFKRAQWLQQERNQRHAQMSDRVISSQPAMALKKWSEEDWFAARRAEIDLFKLPVPQEEMELEAPTQSIPINGPFIDCPLVDEILWRYDNAARIAEAAVTEFDFHLRADHYPMDIVTYASHKEGSIAQSHLMRADAAYIRAMRASGEERTKFAALSLDEYRKARALYTRHILRFFMGDEETDYVLGKGITRMDVGDPVKVPDDRLDSAFARLEQKHVAGNWQLSNSEDLKEIAVYVYRARARQQALAPFVK
jgi:hypothetical protein